MAGVELKGSPRFCVGSVVNAGASGGLLDLEIDQMEKKMAAGAEFFLTPAVFDLQNLSRFQKRVAELTPKIIPTVLLLKSVGMARYIERHMDNVTIAENLITRIQKAPDKTRECVRIAQELVGSVRDSGYAGVLLSTIGWEDKLPNILGD
jgi:5,10-methylenetetrahydrofolate reductase